MYFCVKRGLAHMENTVESEGILKIIHIFLQIQK